MTLLDLSLENYTCYVDRKSTRLNSSHTDIYMHLQSALDHDFQSFYGMGYDSNTALDNLGPNGNKHYLFNFDYLYYQ